VRVGLWICGRGDGDAGLGAYVGEDWLDDVEVSHLCAAEGWELEPDDKEGLESKVPRDIVEDDTEGEGFEEVEEAKDDPVGEPLYVVMGRGRFNGLERQVGG